ncbi:Ig-like domain-containing protein [Patulibacter minatonensis]|uniref:Ig-like domain-containing protein n=1 Tax=Patulibacter minatonensis TaxID=298163 RepID=UPI00047EE6C4|nr:Ig-like domain-containing protein [Patulibacter minatonensis]
MTSPPLRRLRRTLLAVVLVGAAAPAAASAATYTVDDDRAQCPSAGFTSIQDAVDQAAAHDTVVICDGVYREQSTPPYGNTQSFAQQGSRNGLTITKPLTIRGAGADKVTIMPAAELGDSLAGTVPYLRDGGGNVISVNRQTLGSSDDNENFLDLSGVTVESPDAYAEAGIAFFNTSGRVAKSVVGPLRRPAADAVAGRPHGWGIVQTNSLQSAVLGGIRRQVTVEDSLVTGFGAGGVLFDASVGGADGAATNTTRSNVNAYGSVLRSRIVGAKGGAASTQTGVRYQSGQRGRVTGSEIVDVWNGVAGTGSANARASVGLLLADADTGDDVTNPGVRAFQVTGTTFGGDGFAIYNADAANAAIRTGAPALATGNYWGCALGPVRTGGNVLGAPSSPTTFCQGGSGTDAGTPAAPSLTTEAGTVADPFRTSAAALALPAKTPDAAPEAAIVDPTAGDVVPVGTTISPVVRASDDFGVRSVTLTAAGAPVATLSTRPYEFSYTPTAAQAGTTVPLTATVTDSAGQTTTTTVSIVVPALPTPPVATTPDAPTTPAAPAPPASPDPPAAPVLKTVSSSTRSARLDSQGRFAFEVACGKGSGSCRVRVLVRRTSSIVGSRTLTIAAGKSFTVRMRPTAAMRRTLRRGDSATVKVSFSGDGLKLAATFNLKVLPRK